MEARNAKEELSFKQDENSRLFEQAKTLREDLHEAKLELTKLQQLESVVGEMKRVKEQLGKSQEQHDAVLEELKLSQLNLVSLEDKLRNSQQQCKDIQIQREGLDKEKNDLQHQVIAMKSEHEQQVHITYIVVLLQLSCFIFG